MLHRHFVRLCLLFSKVLILLLPNIRLYYTMMTINILILYENCLTMRYIALYEILYK